MQNSFFKRIGSINNTPKNPQLKPSAGLFSVVRATKIFGCVAHFFLYKQASLTQATRKASKRVSTLVQPPSKDAPINTLFLMVFILYPFILEFFNNSNTLIMRL